MGNTLTNLIPTIYAALDVVSRELVGFIPAVYRDTALERAALNQSILVPITPASSAADNTPGVTPPDTGDQTIGNTSITISKSKHVPIRWNGEDTRGMQNAGTYGTTLQQQFEQAFRTLTNLIEVDLGTSYKSASRAYGTAATAPFGTAGDLSDAAGVRQILDDNGCPQSDLHLVVNSAAMFNLRGKQSVLFKVNEAGTDEMLRRGTIGEIEGFNVGYSGQVASVTKGTGTSYQLNNGAGYAAGSTSIAVDTGSGTILAGDVLTNTQSGRDANKYVVGTTLSAGTLVLNKPGSQVAWVDNDTVAVGNSYKANLAFHRSAIVLVTRPPALPVGGDMADDTMMVTDPISGITFEIAIYRQFLQQTYHVRLAWGFAAIKSENIAILLG